MSKVLTTKLNKKIRIATQKIFKMQEKYGDIQRLRDKENKGKEEIEELERWETILKKLKRYLRERDEENMRKYKRLHIIKHALEYYVTRQGADKEDVKQEKQILKQIVGQIEDLKKEYHIETKGKDVT